MVSKTITKNMKSLIPREQIESKIFLIRGYRVMLDRDLSELYGVKTKYLKRQVRRNIDRFPEDFMFQLSPQEFKNWRRQNVTSNSDKMGLRYRPYAFTQEGVAMLSSVLNSERAIMVNIQIMRAFAQLRRMLLTNRDLKRKIEEMERKYDKQFAIVFQAIKQLLEPLPAKEKKIIGFRTYEDS